MKLNRPLILTALALVAATPASAYIDPGTGSYIFQIILGSVIGMGMALKAYWARVSDFLRRIFRKRGND